MSWLLDFGRAAIGSLINCSSIECTANQRAIAGLTGSPVSLPWFLATDNVIISNLKFWGNGVGTQTSDVELARLAISEETFVLQEDSITVLKEASNLQISNDKLNPNYILLTYVRFAVFLIQADVPDGTMQVQNRKVAVAFTDADLAETITMNTTNGWVNVFTEKGKDLIFNSFVLYGPTNNVSFSTKFFNSYPGPLAFTPGDYLTTVLQGSKSFLQPNTGGAGIYGYFNFNYSFDLGATVQELQPKFPVKSANN